MSIERKTPQQYSREEWAWPGPPELDMMRTGALLRIAKSLERLTELLDPSTREAERRDRAFKRDETEIRSVANGAHAAALARFNPQTRKDSAAVSKAARRVRGSVICCGLEEGLSAARAAAERWSAMGIDDFLSEVGTCRGIGQTTVWRLGRCAVKTPVEAGS